MFDARSHAHRLATWFGLGRSPVAPGTLGALGFLPLHAVLRRTPLTVHAGALIALTALGVWAANEEARASGEHDPQHVVIDEAVGVAIALALVRDRGLLAHGAAFVAFRVLDMWKPLGIDRLETIPPAGVGIMADDVAAGVLAGLLARWIG